MIDKLPERLKSRESAASNRADSASAPIVLHVVGPRIDCGPTSVHQQLRIVIRRCNVRYSA